MATENPLARIDLYVQAGPLKGKRIALNDENPLVLGRSKSGVHLVDPTVSIEHAEVVWESDSYWIVDLRSRTGTFVDGTPIGPTPIRLRPGMEVVIGDSKFFVERRVDRQVWSVPVLAVSTLALVACAVYWVVTIRPVVYQPTLVTEGAEAMLADGTRVNSLAIPIEFIRQEGMDERGLSFERVTDFDNNGVSEVWFHGPTDTKMWVITFKEGGSWEMLGEFPYRLPMLCRDKETELMPVVQCNGELYQFDYELRQYILVGQEGVVVWMHPKSKPAKAKAEKAKAKAKAKAKTGKGGTRAQSKVLKELKPYSVNLSHQEQLVAFLAKRGVHERIHYLVCEDALPDQGVVAHVLTESGKQVPLPLGCLDFMAINGLDKDAKKNFEPKPKMVAFTASGRKAMIADLRVLLAGNNDQAFFSEKGLKLLTQIERIPVRFGAATLRFLVDAGDTEGVAVTQDEPVEGFRRLLNDGKKKAPPLAKRMLIEGDGVYEIEVGLNHQLVMEVEHFICARSKWCMPGAGFITVREVTGGSNRIVASAPYEKGQFFHRSDDLEIQLAVDGTLTPSRFDVQRAWIAVRLTE